MADDDTKVVVPAPAERKKRKRMPPWTDAIPEILNLDDPLELAAKLGPRALAVALVQVLGAVGIKPLARAAVIGQLVGQLKAAVPASRLWEAERAIRNERTAMDDTGEGPKTELKTDAATAQTDPGTSRTKAIRGRPRKRSIL